MDEMTILASATVTGCRPVEMRQRSDESSPELETLDRPRIARMRRGEPDPA